VPQISPPPEEFKTFVDSEIQRWGELVEKAGNCTASKDEMKRSPSVSSDV